MSATMDPYDDLYRACDGCGTRLPDDATSRPCASCDVDVFACATCVGNAVTAKCAYECSFCCLRVLDAPADGVDDALSDGSEPLDDLEQHELNELAYDRALEDADAEDAEEGDETL